jgi:hypothetical protein
MKPVEVLPEFAYMAYKVTGLTKATSSRKRIFAAIEVRFMTSKIGLSPMKTTAFQNTRSKIPVAQNALCLAASPGLSISR